MAKQNLISALNLIINSEDKESWNEQSRNNCSIVLNAIKNIDESLFSNYRSSLLNDSNALADAVYENLDSSGVSGEDEQDELLANVDSNVKRAFFILNN